MAAPGGQGMPYGGPVSYGQPPSAGVAEGGGPHAAPYGDSVHHVAKEPPPPLRAPPPVSVAPPSAAQAKPNGPTVNGSWSHLAGGYTNGPSAKLAPPPPQQSGPPLGPAGVSSSRVNQGYHQPGSSPLGTPTASGEAWLVASIFLSIFVLVGDFLHAWMPWYYKLCWSQRILSS